MKVLRALIVDDERPARRWLRDLLLAHPEIQVIGEADGVNAALDRAGELEPDVLFLDVQMPPGSGFDVLPHLKIRPQIVFVTAYETFAVRAFDANALDYLLKPVHPDRLAETVRRLLTDVEKEISTPSPGEVAPPVEASQSDEPQLSLNDYVPLRDRGLLRVVSVADIAAIEAEGAYSRIMISGQEPMLVLPSIGEWECRLPAPPFHRLDRSRLVNLSSVAEVKALTRDRADVTLRGITPSLSLGRAGSRRLRKLLSQFHA